MYKISIFRTKCTLEFVLWVTLLSLFVFSSAFASAVMFDRRDPSEESNAGNRCFCQLKGLIDDCSCSVESIDNFNNVQVYPLLKGLLERNFFKYWRVNLQKKCPFWSDDSRCTIRYCNVEECKEVPPGILRDVGGECTGEEHLGVLNTTISLEFRAGFEVWAAHDSAQDSGFCEPEDDQSPGSAYVDLLVNPERYTGYQGASAHRVWRSIYMENCFRPSREEATTGSNSPFFHLTDSTTGMCLEKRTFYRAISGFHASINIHLSARYLLSDDTTGLGDAAPVWGANLREFQQRFDPALTASQGPTWLKNLYFLYLIELRALAKAGPQLKRMQFFTGDAEEDADVRMAVTKLVQVARSFQHFDESTYFSNGQQSLKEQFRLHFRNITRIMDCVGCDKCKLWGKLQITGLGTALKILFSGDFDEEEEAEDLSSNQKAKNTENIKTLKDLEDEEREENEDLQGIRDEEKENTKVVQDMENKEPKNNENQEDFKDQNGLIDLENTTDGEDVDNVREVKDVVQGMDDLTDLKDLKDVHEAKGSKTAVYKSTKLNLTRSEVVALLNAFGRLSESIIELEHFRKLAER